jgi:hypothetical protein
MQWLTVLEVFVSLDIQRGRCSYCHGALQPAESPSIISSRGHTIRWTWATT